MKAFFEGFEKRSFMELEDVEDALGGYYLPQRMVPAASQLLEQEKEKSFALRHPVISGIPTFGLWPAIAEEKALGRIKGKLIRSNPEFGIDVNREEKRRLMEERAHEIAIQQKLIADREAQAREHMMAIGAGTALSGLNSYLRSKERERE